MITIKSAGNFFGAFSLKSLRSLKSLTTLKTLLGKQFCGGIFAVSPMNRIKFKIMKKYVCNVCEWVYDPEIGDPDG